MSECKDCFHMWDGKRCMMKGHNMKEAKYGCNDFLMWNDISIPDDIVFLFFKDRAEKQVNESLARVFKKISMS